MVVKPAPVPSSAPTYAHAKAKDDRNFQSYVPSPTMKRFHESPAKFRGVMGPIGSGKSSGCCWEVLRLAMMQEPWNGVRKVRVAIVRATYSELTSTTIRTWRDWFNSQMCPLKEHESPISGRMRIRLGDGTLLDLEVFFCALEREEDTRKVLGMELTGIWFNEAKELPWGIVRDGMSRIGRFPAKREGGCTRKFAIADTNPPDDEHWWYKLAEEGRLVSDAEGITSKDFEFFRQPPALILTEQGYAPNPAAENVEHLTDGYGYWIDQIPGREPEWVSVYVLGNYGVIADGQPVYGRTYSDSIHCAPMGLLPIKGWPVVASLDFGRTPAAVFGQQNPRGQLRILEEITTMDTDIRAMCRDLIKPKLLTTYKGCPVYITGDPAGDVRSDRDSQSCYDIVREELRGLFQDVTPCEDTSNALTPRLDAVKTFLRRLAEGHPGFYLSPECKMLRKGFQGRYKYRTIRAPGGGVRTSEVPDKDAYSHPHDALQYLCMYVLGGLKTGLSRNMTPVAGMKPADSVAGY